MNIADDEFSVVLVELLVQQLTGLSTARMPRLCRATLMDRPG